MTFQSASKNIMVSPFKHVLNACLTCFIKKQVNAESESLNVKSDVFERTQPLLSHFMLCCCQLQNFHCVLLPALSKFPCASSRFFCALFDWRLKSRERDYGRNEYPEGQLRQSQSNLLDIDKLVTIKYLQNPVCLSSAAGTWSYLSKTDGVA